MRAGTPAHYLERSADGGLGVGLGQGRVGARDGMGGRGGRPHFGAIGGGRGSVASRRVAIWVSSSGYKH